MRTERDWSPEQIWSIRMIDRVNSGLCAIADARGDRDPSYDDLQGNGFDLGAPLPPDDGLFTVEFEDVDFELSSEILTRLYNDINPLATSSYFGIDFFERGVQI